MFDPLTILVPNAVHLIALLAILLVLAFARRAPGALKATLATLLAWAWIFSTPALANLVVLALEGPPAALARVPPFAGKEPLILVLSSGTLFSGDGRPNARLDAHGWARLHAGMTLWKSVGGTLILSGGPDGDPELSLAALMRRVAIEAGIPEGAIRIAPRSRTTYEDLAQSRDAIQRHGAPAILVTSALHMPRALAVGRALGLSLTPFPCDYMQLERPTWQAWLPSSGGPRLWLDALHEVFGIAWYRMRGRAA
jgi:uncharacterized SAM-binding protein YcdF (DUF218 family)